MAVTRAAAAASLSPFGWDNVVIPDNLANICAHLPKWSQLKILRNPQLVGSRNVQFPHTYFHDEGGNPFMPAFEKGVLHNSGGGYASIYKGTRAIYKPIGDRVGMVHLDRVQGFEEVCVKEVQTRADPDEPETAFEEDIKAILYEAYLHALLCKFLEDTPLRTTVPVLHEVVATTISGLPPEDPSDIDSVWMTMEFVEGTTLEKHLRRIFLPGKFAENDKILLDILLQLAHLLGFLQASLRFNHRDMKINNVYVRHHAADSAAWERYVPLGAAAAAGSLSPPHVAPAWRTIHDIVLIDFGFSCVACGTGFVNPRATLLGAGSYFKPEHDCLKTGRDLAQFLYSLHCSFPLQSHISPPLFAALHGAMVAVKDGRRVDMWQGFDLSGNPLPPTATLPIALPFHKGVYNFLREGTTDVPGCAPATLIETLTPFAMVHIGGAAAAATTARHT
jgi:serine/threonine protein kinase